LVEVLGERLGVISERHSCTNRSASCGVPVIRRRTSL